MKMSVQYFALRSLVGRSNTGRTRSPVVAYATRLFHRRLPLRPLQFGALKKTYRDCMANILVVDDDEVARELLYLHLAGAGYGVKLAEDAIEAGYVLLEQHVDLLVADIEMPFMDGIDLVRAIKSDPAVASLPVVFITSNAEHEDQARALGAAFLRKPLRADELLASVARQLKTPSSVGAAVR